MTIVTGVPEAFFLELLKMGFGDYETRTEGRVPVYLTRDKDITVPKNWTVISFEFVTQIRSIIGAVK